MKPTKRNGRSSMEHALHHQANVVDLHPRTKGKRVLYITNRADGVLQEELSRALQAARFKFGVVAGESPNRVRAMQASVSSGSYDVVLFVEGFNGHVVYDALVSACQASPTPTALVLVGKGRVAEVQRAISAMTLPPQRPRRNDREAKMPRWSGAEIARLEDLALEGKADLEISLCLKNEFDVDRSDKSIALMRSRGVGIVRGKKVGREGSRALPQEYYDLRQAQRIREELHPAVPAIEATSAVKQIEEVIARVDAQPLAPPPAAIQAATPASARVKVVPVTITGSQGTVLLESKRSLAEIVQFLIGET